MGDAYVELAEEERMFEVYESELRSGLKSLQRDADALGLSGSLESSIAACEEKLQDLKGTLKALEVEARCMSSSERQKVRKRVEKYRKDVKVGCFVGLVALWGVSHSYTCCRLPLRQSLSSAIQRHRKNALFGDHGFNEGTTGYDQRERMAHVTERLEDMDDRLGDAQRTLAETEDVALGMSVLESVLAVLFAPVHLLSA